MNQLIRTRDYKTIGNHFNMFHNALDISLSYLEDLSKVIKKEYLLGKIDLYSYERQINLLTCSSLQLQELNKQSKKFISEGVYIDKKV